MKLILTGATGTAGSETLTQTFLDKDITKVIALQRKPFYIMIF